MLTTIVARSVLGSPITVTGGPATGAGRLAVLIVLNDARNRLSHSAYRSGSADRRRRLRAPPAAGSRHRARPPLLLICALTLPGNGTGAGTGGDRAERRNVADAIRRSLALTRRRFWRTPPSRARRSRQRPSSFWSQSCTLFDGRKRGFFQRPAAHIRHRGNPWWRPYKQSARSSPRRSSWSRRCFMSMLTCLRRSDFTLLRSSGRKQRAPNELWLGHRRRCRPSTSTETAHDAAAREPPRPSIRKPAARPVPWSGSTT